ncbi:PQQ-binding-like beta-propeller repeat protein [Siphonobacter sp. SORGH_AS_0500]|uniref:PQQ-binding-like beta-propeller repeat protein n=1 Tax=Siphonobacter sp. SORGH_AS_0500 TaxID=1864824 RepID=UPI0028626BD7|nr:PQQ-binding-like beta-propeller repeat protein [Siphonobacter sp. SORGH_AS_0500]MDR6194702.1 outer membrane protein assembly factor BamB [Siphonobacter sp. SORGH_AS_0500]
MKKYLLFICLSTLLFSSCRKKKDDPKPPVNETIITTSALGRIYSLNAHTWNVNWSTEEYYTNTEPAIFNNIVYIGKQNYYGPSYVVGYDLSTGKEVFKVFLEPSLRIRTSSSNLTVTDKYIFVHTEFNLVAIDRVQKQMVWKWTSEEGRGVRIIYSDDTVYADTGYFLYAINPHSGKTIWKSQGYVGSNHLVGNYKNLLYVSPISSDNEPLYAFDKQTGALKWKKSEANNATSVVLHENSLFVGTRQGDFYALDPLTGSTQWSIHLTDNEFNNAPCVTGNYVFIANSKTTYAIDIKARKVKWTYDIISPPNHIYSISDPVAANDKVYLKAGKLFAFDINTGLPEIISSPDTEEFYGTVPIIVIDSNKKIHCSWNSEMKSQY